MRGRKKHLICFQSEHEAFKFLRGSMNIVSGGGATSTRTTRTCVVDKDDEISMFASGLNLNITFTFAAYKR